jgi:cytochrome c oxidase subunit II
VDEDNDNGLVGWIIGLGVATALTVTLGAIMFAVMSDTSTAPPAVAPSAAAPAAAAAPAPLSAPVAAAPAAAPAAVQATAIEPARVFFDSGKTELPADAAAALQPVIDAARARADAKLAVSGFHDKSGNLELNAELAKKRAFAVRDALVAAGIADTRIELRKPQDMEGGNDAREARRVEVTVE